MFSLVTHETHYAEPSHVNLQDLREALTEIRQECGENVVAERIVNSVDSLVTLGAMAKGRSSSAQVKGLLRAYLGYFLVGRKYMHNFNVNTRYNPADDPSQFAKLRDAEPASEWLEPFLVPDIVVSRSKWNGPKYGIELFGRLLGIMLALRAVGLPMFKPFEA